QAIVIFASDIARNDTTPAPRWSVVRMVAVGPRSNCRSHHTVVPLNRDLHSRHATDVARAHCRMPVGASFAPRLPGSEAKVSSRVEEYLIANRGSHAVSILD